MIPLNTFTAEPIYSPLLDPYSDEFTPFSDRHRGGIAISDGSKGRDYQIWEIRYADGVASIYLEESLIPSYSISIPEPDMISVAFDNNMRPTIAYVISNVGYLYYYDTLTESYSTISISGITSSRARIDDVSDFYNSTSDVLWIYTLGDTVRWRQQRDRYTVEYIVGAAGGKVIKKAGMNQLRRFQIELNLP